MQHTPPPTSLYVSVIQIVLGTRAVKFMVNL